MGKRQHQKDKMYLTYTEWGTLYGGKKNVPEKASKRLRFGLCCITFQPFAHPYCDENGYIFELEAIVKYIKKFKTNPVTGKPLEAASLIKLNFSRNESGGLQCPVLFKDFTAHSHIVAVKETGNVFSFEAVEQLNIKPKNWKDLLTDVSFQRNNLITLQDPNNLEKLNIDSFHHIKAQKLLDVPKESGTSLKSVNKEALDILETLKKEYKPIEVESVVQPVADKINAAHYSTGTVAAGFTSTALAPETVHKPAIVAEDDIRYERVKKKGYVRFITNLGPLNLELYCNVIHKTCENFIKLCHRGYYNKTVFHRSIRHFMVQGGDPTGTGNGGESIWGKPFEDDIKPHLNHTGRGVLSMANAGPNSNKSQFFITYRSCRHLDGKHTVFGQIVGGLDTLAKIERIEVDNKDRPIEDIIILSTHVFVDPFQEADEQLVMEREAVLIENKADENITPSEICLKEFRCGIGKYINTQQIQETTGGTDTSPEKRRKCENYKFNDFSNW